VNIFQRIWHWWTWRNADKVNDMKLRKAMLYGVITPAEALKAQETRCKHERITIIGNEEDGVRSISCTHCGKLMERKIENGEYFYQ
jgi:hypothetical protein